MTKIGKLAALALTASATIATVTPSFAEVANAGTNAAAAAQASSKQSADTKKYCLLLEPLTGSRMRERSCRTKAEWKAEGIEVPPKS